jgi:hypothetical protein
MKVTPHDGLHKLGESIGFSISDIDYPYLVIFSLSGDGTVHFHFPLADEPEQITIGRPVQYEFDVAPPFGADHIIAVNSRNSLKPLIAQLNSLDGGDDAEQAVEAVLKHLGEKSRLGLQGLYTAER